MPMLMTLRIRLPVWPFHSPLAHPVAEGRHLVQHGMHAGNNILAIDNNLFALGRAQRDMQHRPLLGDIDLVSSEHGVDVLAQSRLFRQLKQQLQGFVGDPVLRVVQEQPYGLGRETLATLGIIRKQLPQMRVAHGLVVGPQGLPCRAVG